MNRLSAELPQISDSGDPSVTGASQRHFASFDGGGGGSVGEESSPHAEMPRTAATQIRLKREKRTGTKVSSYGATTSNVIRIEAGAQRAQPSSGAGSVLAEPREALRLAQAANMRICQPSRMQLV